MEASLALITIIPISKLLGNYNCCRNSRFSGCIIPISKLLGNYNLGRISFYRSSIIPISKLLGNYNSFEVVL